MHIVTVHPLVFLHALHNTGNLEKGKARCIVFLLRLRCRVSRSHFLSSFRSFILSHTASAIAKTAAHIIDAIVKPTKTPAPKSIIISPLPRSACLAAAAVTLPAVPIIRRLPHKVRCAVLPRFLRSLVTSCPAFRAPLFIWFTVRVAVNRSLVAPEAWRVCVSSSEHHFLNPLPI